MAKQSPPNRKKRLKKASTSTDKQKQQRVLVEKLPIESDPALRLTWVDQMKLERRSDIPIATIRFFSITTEKLTEACRLQTTVGHLRQIVDVICRNIDYYPQKPGS